jgi:DNA-binding GntR family transcriptional regulator
MADDLGSRNAVESLGRERLPSLANWRTAQDFAKETLRSAILRGDLPGGARLVQADLAAQLGVSTTPIREALRDLAAAGLIRLDRNRGGVVRELNWQEMEDIRQIQDQLMPLAVKLAIQGMTDEELAEAELLTRQMDEETDPATWVDLNLRFHFLFCLATGRGRLSDILVTLEEGSALYVAQAQRWHPEARRKANEDHRALVAAFRERNVKKAVAALAGHAAISIDTTQVERHAGTQARSAGRSDGKPARARVAGRHSQAGTRGVSIDEGGR